MKTHMRDEVARLRELLEQQTYLNVDLQVANEELMRECDRLLVFRSACRDFEERILPLAKAEANELVMLAEQATARGMAAEEEVEKWKRRYIFAKSEFDRLILERRVESGTA